LVDTDAIGQTPLAREMSDSKSVLHTTCLFSGRQRPEKVSPTAKRNLEVTGNEQQLVNSTEEDITKSHFDV
jgi:hypothetical protein